MKINYIAVDIGNTFLPGNPLTQLSGISLLTSIFVQNMGVVAGITFLFMIVFAGISIINGAGKGSPQSVAQGKAAATWAIVGLLVVVFGYFIVRLIQSITGVNILGGTGGAAPAP